MHTAEIQFISRVHSGDMPSSWLTGDEKFQKAKVVAAITWHSIRPEGDPELPACDLTFQQRLIGEVEGLLDGNPPGSPFGEAAAECLRQIAEQAHAATTANQEGEPTDATTHS